jgi:hypothetical protein
MKGIALTAAMRESSRSRRSRAASISSISSNVGIGGIAAGSRISARLGAIGGSVSPLASSS